MADVTFRRAAAGDAPDLQTCIGDAYQRYADTIQDLPDVTEGIAEDIEDHQVWVAEAGGGIVGGLVLIAMEDHLLLANIAVAPAMSGQGVGRALLGMAEKVCIEAGVGELRLSTHVAMPDNVRLYEHFGWHESGRSGNKVHMVKRFA